MLMNHECAQFDLGMHVFSLRRCGYVRETLAMIHWCYLNLFADCLKAKTWFIGKICFTKLIITYPTIIKLQHNVAFLTNDMTKSFPDQNRE